MKRAFILAAFLCGLLVQNPIQAQKIILGDSPSDDISVRSSDQYRPWNRSDSCLAASTIGGAGLIYDELSASRFLYQATLGSNLDEIRQLTRMGFENWIDHQMQVPATTYQRETQNAYDEVVDWHFSLGGDSADIASRPDWRHFQYGWWTAHMNNPDKLRQRIALALSEIFVVSIDSDLQGHGLGVSSYYDLFSRNAFGSFEDLLLQVTLHPAMGFYLSHLNNPKTDTAENTRPDENYAREIMQLFTIGLLELHPDGRWKLDSMGKPIPTYTQRDIKEFAKIFTGLGISAVMPNMYTDTAVFGMGIYLADMTKPMKMYESYHEPGVKQLLNGFSIPEGQTGMEDIRDAVRHLVHHPNTGPFICKQLIQRLIKSNPTPEYVERVSRIFDNDGKDQKGNLAAVIKAILLDPEARDCADMMAPSNGQLREPLLRYSHFVRAIDIEQYYGRYWNIGYEYWAGTGQIPLAAPSVFNFFSPFYTPRGEISNQGLVAPEFQIHNSRTSINYLNSVNAWSVYDYVMYSWEPDEPAAILNLASLKPYAQDPEVLVNRLDLLLTHGQLGDRTRGIIKETLSKFKSGDFRDQRVRMALYLMMISPDYAIFK
ncbi:MAG TPA: DUF1800 domain-containing protein [Saprospiraceae bacterium]|nr:DUF1800 domain-containing protein [Saprospiraceae bacterium]